MTRDDFVRLVAQLDKDGELVDGQEFVLENDDAVDTLHWIIDAARSLLGDGQGDSGGEAQQ
jgi:hypothetical protein